MRVLEPKEEIKKQKMLKIGDILVDKELGAYVLMKVGFKYIFRPLAGYDGGYNGFHDSLEEITESINAIISRKDGNVKIYRASEYDLQLIPRQD
jgi:hypothetical protein